MRLLAWKQLTWAGVWWPPSLLLRLCYLIKFFVPKSCSLRLAKSLSSVSLCFLTLSLALCQPAFAGFTCNFIKYGALGRDPVALEFFEKNFGNPDHFIADYRYFFVATVLEGTCISPCLSHVFGVKPAGAYYAFSFLGNGKELHTDMLLPIGSGYAEQAFLLFNGFAITVRSDDAKLQMVTEQALRFQQC